MFENLTNKQIEIVSKEGKTVIRACPGSGKTYAVGARLASKMSTWDKTHQGIAVLSFTNVAWQEIEKNICNNYKDVKPMPYPHFLGTIDSFINNFIFLPFGHLILGCRNRPKLVGEPHNTWIGRNFSENLFDNLTYDINGNVIALDVQKMRHNWMDNRYIVPTKKRMNVAGYETQKDAMFFAMKLVENYAFIRKAIIYRFPMIIIDEAQDTSDIQMRIIQLLIDNGLEQLMLVGDPDQAIFEWNEAKPELFNEMYERWKENSIIFNENRRSSQNICNFTYKLSSLPEVSNSISEDKNFDYTPEIVTYDIDNLQSLIDYFINKCIENAVEINPKDVAVLARSQEIVSRILGHNIESTGYLPWNEKDFHTKDFVKGKFLYDHGNFSEGFTQFERALFKVLNDSNICCQSDVDAYIEKIGFFEYRSIISSLINLLPNTSCKLGEWISQSNSILDLNGLGRIKLEVIKKKADVNIEMLFSDNKFNQIVLPYRVGTIHSAKGETFEAVMIILKKRGKGKHYKTLLRDNENVKNQEELRIVYVGITRPRRLLMIAVPDEENKTAWETKFNN
jgi:DNA helicase II / ATP-dependent DNA helicase PcrA